MSTDTSDTGLARRGGGRRAGGGRGRGRLTAGLPGVGSRRLLRELLTPYKRMLQLIVGIVLVENAARLAIPFLVKEGIDTGIPPIQASNDLQPLLAIVACVLLATIVQALARNRFLVPAGPHRPGRALRGPPPGVPALPGAEPGLPRAYTSGRVISRQTSDIDAIYEMLESGFDGLVTAALTLVGTAGILLVLDVKLGLVALLCGPFLALLTNWFRKASAKSYRVTREKVALVIVHFVETMGGMRAVQAFRREPRNQEIFDDVNDQYRAANLVAFRLVALFMPGIRLIGNITIALVLLYGGYLAYHGQVTVGVLAAFLLYLRQFFEPMMEISQFYNTFQSASAALDKLAGVLDEEPDVAEPLHPVPLDDRARRPALRPRRVLLRRGPAGPARPRPQRARRADPRAGRHHRRGQDHAGQAGDPVLRPDRGRVLLDGVDLRDLTSDDAPPRRWSWSPRRTTCSAARSRTTSASDGPRRRWRTWSGRPRALGAHDFITAMPEGYDTPGGQPGRTAQRGPAPAGRLRPGLPRRPGGAHPRRGHLVAGHPVGAAGPAGAAHRARRPHRRDHRPPALDRGDRRPGARHGARPRSSRTAAPPTSSPAAPAASPTCTRPGSSRCPDGLGRGAGPSPSDLP